MLLPVEEGRGGQRGLQQPGPVESGVERRWCHFSKEKVVMASGLFDKWQEKTRAEEARYACVTVSKALHPVVAARVVPVIEACTDVSKLRRWTLRATRLSDAEFARLVTGRGRTRLTRRRAPRPARKAARAGGR